jgi:Cu/Ag efflux pump CusA
MKTSRQSRLTRGLARWAQLLIVDTLSGAEGHIFGPMAKTYAYAIAGGLIAAFTITPALSAPNIALSANAGYAANALSRLRRLSAPYQIASRSYLNIQSPLALA